ncbi:MAG: hypothetical protein ABIT09_08130 [Croceibacterium sp.]
MTETPSEQAERRAVRRRLINVGELVAVVGLVIAAASLYLGWADRRDSASQRSADQAEARTSAARDRGHVGLIATGVDDDVLTFKGAACALQSTDISFPTALGVAAQNTVLEHRIEAGWFAKPLLAAVAFSKAGQGRLPVLIDSDCIDEKGPRSEHAIYDLAYRIDSRFLRGQTVRLRGLVLREYVSPARAQARLDAVWRATAPAAPAKS